MDHKVWLEQTVSGDSVRAAAHRAGIPQRTLATQSEKKIAAENIIKIAAAYNVHPVRALVDTGYLDARYAKQVDPVTALRSVSEEQLADEVLRRMKKGMKTKALTTPIDELATRRSKTATPDVERELYVADNSPDEDAMRGDDEWD